MQFRGKTHHMLFAALLASMAVCLNAAERFIPAALPWMKPGFANIITIIALQMLGLRTALAIVILRVTLSALIFGTFSVQFALAMGGAVTAALIMHGILKTRLFSSLVPVSICGACAHNIAQLFIVWYFLITAHEVFLQLPFMLIFSTASGWFNGIAASICLRRLNAADWSDSIDT